MALATDVGKRNRKYMHLTLLSDAMGQNEAKCYKMCREKIMISNVIRMSVLPP